MELTYKLYNDLLTDLTAVALSALQTVDGKKRPLDSFSNFEFEMCDKYAHNALTDILREFSEKTNEDWTVLPPTNEDLFELSEYLEDFEENA